MGKTDSVVLSAELLILEIFKQNINLDIKSKVNIKTDLMNFENFKITFAKNQEGFVLKFFRQAMKAPLLVFFPDDFLSKYVNLENDKNTESELLDFMGIIPQYLLKDFEVETNSLNIKSALIDIHSSRLSNKNELLWNISSYEIIQIKIDSFFCFIFIEPKIFLGFKKNCNNNEIFLNSLKDYTPHEFPVIKVSEKQYENQTELLIGRFFLPRLVLLGENPAVSGFDTIIFEPEPGEKREGLDIVLNLTIDGVLYNLSYFVPSNIESRANLTVIIQSLIKSVLPFWRKYFVIEKVGASKKLSDTFQAASIFKGGVRYKNSFIPIEIGLSKDILELLTVKLIEKDNSLLSNFSCVLLIEEFLVSVFLNENLFLPLSLSEFLNLIDEIDLRRIIQNFFSGTGWKGNELQKLFSYSKKDYQNKKVDYYPDPSFNRKIFFKYLPRVQKDEWLKTRSASVSLDEMNTCGRKALLDIYHSWRADHLDLSFRAITLLLNEFKVKGDKKLIEEIDHKMVSEPISDLLEDTFPRDVQNLLAKLTAKVLANALVLYTDSYKLLEPFMSRNYKTEVKDLIKIIQRKSLNSGFEMEEIQEDFFILHNGLKNLSKEEFI